MLDSQSILASAKQQSQFIKKALSIPLNEAQSLIATSSRFRDWNDFNNVLIKSPGDDRLPAVAVSDRASLAIMTTRNVEQARGNQVRFVRAINHPAASNVWLRSRGFDSDESCNARFHHAVDGYRIVAKRSLQAEPYRLNLWELPARLLFLSGRSGSGKSFFALSMALQHAKHGGHVEAIGVDTRLDAFIEPDHPAHKRIRIGKLPLDASPVNVDWDGLAARLPPASLIIIDEWYFAVRSDVDEALHVIDVLMSLTEHGHAVVIVTMDPMRETWPILSGARDLRAALPKDARVISGESLDYGYPPEHLYNQLLSLPDSDYAKTALGTRWSFVDFGSGLSQASSPLLRMNSPSFGSLDALMCFSVPDPRIESASRQAFAQSNG